MLYEGALALLALFRGSLLNSAAPFTFAIICIWSALVAMKDSPKSTPENSLVSAIIQAFDSYDARFSIESVNRAFDTTLLQTSSDAGGVSYGALALKDHKVGVLFSQFLVNNHPAGRRLQVGWTSGTDLQFVGSVPSDGCVPPSAFEAEFRAAGWSEVRQIEHYAMTNPRALPPSGTFKKERTEVTLLFSSGGACFIRLEATRH